jgi:hypothetical protein
MSEPSDAEREADARARAEKFKGEQLGTAALDRAFLLRLLDAERARADRAWGDGYNAGVVVMLPHAREDEQEVPF